MSGGAIVAGERCIRCSDPPAPGRVRCEKHLALARQQANDEYRRRRDAGLCARNGCDKPAEPGRVRCAAHAREAADIVATIYAKRRGDGTR